MSWMQKLCDTYDACKSAIGSDSNGVPLLPICHTTNMAQVKISLDAEGNFIDAKVLEKAEARTIIPCTEESAGRTSGKVPHPLCDKLEYVAGDYSEYCQGTSDFENYVKNLRDWCNDVDYANPKVKAVLSYVEKKRLIHDLVSKQILFLDESGKLLTSWKNDEVEKPEIYSVTTGSVDSIFVKWAVQIPGDPVDDLSRDKSVWNSWIGYYLNLLSNSEDYNVSTDMVTGRNMPIAKNHPKKIRNDGDGAKIISSNDMSDFTFRGRFTEPDQACTIGYETTQKAHNALRWLIARQGVKVDTWCFVAWDHDGQEVITPLSDPFDMYDDDDLDENVLYTAEATVKKLNSKILGNYQDADTLGIVMMSMDSAVPGRLAVLSYREFNGSEYCERMEKWYSSYAWPRIKKRVKTYLAELAPTPNEISKAVYGYNVESKHLKSITETIVSCIMDGDQIPKNYVEVSVRRASNPLAYRDEWTWEQTVSTACALFRGLNSKEEYKMTLETERRSRDYLYGRLLAVADALEGRAHYFAGESRPTNAIRLMQKFSEKPYTTWNIIHDSLVPYKMRLGAGSRYFEELFEEIMDLFDSEEFKSNKRLSGEYLLGFYTQKSEIRKKNKNKNNEKSEEELNEHN